MIIYTCMFSKRLEPRFVCTITGKMWFLCETHLPYNTSLRFVNVHCWTLTSLNAYLGITIIRTRNGILTMFIVSSFRYFGTVASAMITGELKLL